MSAGRWRWHWWGIVVGALGLASLFPGCTDPPEPVAPRPGPWRVQAVEAPGGGTPLRLGLTLKGAPGYLRTTLIVERPADPVAGMAARSALYDNPFPVGPEAQLHVEITPPVFPATAPRVTQRVESAGVVSNLFVEPAVPFFEPGAAVTWKSALTEGQTLSDGAEVEVGRWTVAVGKITTMVVVRVLGSRRPIGPRLKGLGSPPT